MTLLAGCLAPPGLPGARDAAGVLLDPVGTEGRLELRVSVLVGVEQADQLQVVRREQTPVALPHGAEAVGQLVEDHEWGDDAVLRGKTDGVEEGVSPVQLGNIAQLDPTTAPAALEGGRVEHLVEEACRVQRGRGGLVEAPELHTSEAALSGVHPRLLKLAVVPEAVLPPFVQQGGYVTPARHQGAVGAATEGEGLAARVRDPALAVEDAVSDGVATLPTVDVVLRQNRGDASVLEGDGHR